jgi:hypothetical protein
MTESRRFGARAGSTTRSRHIGSIGANRADWLGRGRSRGSVPRGIESNARAAHVVRSRGWAHGRTHTVDLIGGQLAGFGDELIGPSP